MIERHIEKIVLGVFVLLFLLVVIHWGVSSPREIEVIADRWGTTETVPPDQVDGKLVEAAKQIEDLVRGAAPEPPGPSREGADYPVRLAGLQDRPFTGRRLADVAPPGAMLTGQDDGEELARPTLADIGAAMPKPTKPAVIVERELPRKDGGEAPADIIAAHVAATYPWRKLDRQWNSKLATTSLLASLIPVAVEAEISERRFDGTWGPPRAKEVW